MLRRLIPLLLGVALVATAAAVLVTRSQSERAAFGCPRGFVKESEPGERDNGQECARLGHPETQAEVLSANAARRSRATAPFYEVKPGAGLAAAHQAAALRASQSDVAGANGQWSPLGSGPLDAGDPTYDTTNGQTLEGFKFVSGRIEDFAYDPAGKRLFASAVNGGVWQSDDMGGPWKPIGDGLPTQVVGALAWTPANGGTLIALTGDPAYGGSSSAGPGPFRLPHDRGHRAGATGAPARRARRRAGLRARRRPDRSRQGLRRHRGGAAALHRRRRQLHRRHPADRPVRRPHARLRAARLQGLLLGQHGHRRRR